MIVVTYGIMSVIASIAIAGGSWIDGRRGLWGVTLVVTGIYEAMGVWYQSQDHDDVPLWLTMLSIAAIVYVIAIAVKMTSNKEMHPLVQLAIASGLGFLSVWIVAYGAFTLWSVL